MSENELITNLELSPHEIQIAMFGAHAAHWEPLLNTEKK